MILHSKGFALYACVGFLWFAVNYLPSDPFFLHRPDKTLKWRRWEIWVAIRSSLAGVTVSAIAGWRHALVIGLLILVGCLLLPLSRRYLVPEARLAEIEILINLVFATLALETILHFGLELQEGLFSIGDRFAHLPNYLLSAGLLIFSLRGGTYIVRGTLARGGMPPNLNVSDVTNNHPELSTRTQLNHGRLIGDVERLILALLVANGQYASLAFFFAAKGLIRSKDLELRAWADYLLLGSLTSFLIALVIGILIAKVMQWG